MEVSTELRGCGRMTVVVGTDAVETGGVQKTGPGKLKPDVVVEVLVELAGATVVERLSRKSEDVENPGTAGKLVSKRPKVLLEPCI